MLVSIWLLSVAASSPLLFINDVTEFGVPGVFLQRACEEHWGSQEARQFYNLLIFVLLFVLPLLIMALLYVRISLALFLSGDGHLFETTAFGKQVAGTSASRLLKQRRKTVRTLILLVVMFGVSWLPFYVVNIWLDFHTSTTTSMVLVSYVYPIVQVMGRVVLPKFRLFPILFVLLSC
jgi:hypothetical protein